MKHINRRRTASNGLSWIAFSETRSTLIQLFSFLVLVVLSTSLSAQSVSGTVTGSDGVPLIGASIIIQGTGTGTVTDLDGKFTMEEIAPGTVLVITYTGYYTQKLVAASNMEVVLESGALLEEVVVTGVLES